MAVKLIILLGESPDLPLKWMRVDEHGKNLAYGHAVSYKSFVSEDYLQPNDEIYAFLPGAVVTYRLIPSPPKGRTPFKAAAKYLLEDNLAEDIESVHIATLVKDFSKVGEANKTPMGLCLAVDKTIMDQWIDCFSKLGVFPKILSVDFLALPILEPGHDKNPVIIFSSDDKVMVNHDQGGFTTTQELARNLLPSILEQWSPEQIDLYDKGNLQDIIEQSDDYDIVFHQGADLKTLSGLMVKSLGPSNSLPNFLTGDYVRKINWRASLRPWRGAMIAACLFMSVFFINIIAQSVRADRNAARFAQLSTQIHQNSFPEARDTDAVIHARKVLSTKSRSIGFLSLWHGIGVAIEGQEGIQIDSINYAGPGRDVRLVVNLDSYETLEIFKTKLGNQGFRAEEGRINQNRNGQFTGELKVQL